MVTVVIKLENRHIFTGNVLHSSGLLELVDFGPRLWTRKHWTSDSVQCTKVWCQQGVFWTEIESEVYCFRVQSPGPKSTDSSKPILPVIAMTIQDSRGGPGCPQMCARSLLEPTIQ